MYGGTKGKHKTRNVAKTREDRKPCRRCGRVITWSHVSDLPGICHECRTTDPAFVQALKSGTPLVPRTGERPEGWAQERRRQWAQAYGEDVAS
jgi:hypothetical protein